MWIKNSKQKPDAMLTFATISFAVVTLNIFLATVGTLSFNTTNITFQHIDSGLMAAYLGSTFTAYVSRRWMDNRYASDNFIQQSIVEDIDEEETEPDSEEEEEGEDDEATEELPKVNIGIP